MADQHTVLLLGGTGRTGRRVLEQLLERGVSVRAIVRDADRLPSAAMGDARLTAVAADLLSLSDKELRDLVRGCDAVISCLGHNTTTLKDIFGPPRDLVTRAVTRVCRAIEALQPVSPIKLILMSSVSVNQPAGRDARRGRFEKAAVSVMRGLVPPSKDNQRAADYLCRAHGSTAGDPGATNPSFEWVTVRPDSLREGEITEYSLHEGLVSSLVRPDSTNMANVAHFMCELVTEPEAWKAWAGKLPVIVNAALR